MNGNVKGIVVDAGHGGSDPGAVSGNLREKDFNLKAAQYMYKRFKDLGIPVAITRDDDRSLTRDERVNTMVNSFGSTPDVLVLSNHINAGGGEGAEVYYPLRSDGVLAGQILDSIGQEGQITRGTFQRRLPENPNQDYYYIQRLTPDTTALLLEYGYIDNPRDASKLQANLLNYVEAVVRAVANYAGVNYTPPTEGDLESGLYTVRAGDTLYDLARTFQITVDELRRANNLSSDLLTIGQVLVIPATVTESDTIEYTVKSGDSLWRIAQSYDVTVDDLRRANSLSSDILQIGQTLYIPTKSQDNTNIPSTIYIVKSGDSLWSIARNYGVSIADIRQANNLTSDLLTIGQQLIIPSESTNVPTRTYTVQPGDTLWKIATQFNTTIANIANLNNLNNSLILPGQVLQIPN